LAQFVKLEENLLKNCSY